MIIYHLWKPFLKNKACLSEINSVLVFNLLQTLLKSLLISAALQLIPEPRVGTRFKNLCSVLSQANFKIFCPFLTSPVLGQVSVLSSVRKFQKFMSYSVRYRYLRAFIFGGQNFWSTFFRLSFAMKNA
jgi:hypothetical protein